MTTLAMTFIHDRGAVPGQRSQRYRVGCSACGWQVRLGSWRATLRAERVHECAAPGPGGRP